MNKKFGFLALPIAVLSGFSAYAGMTLPPETLVKAEMSATDVNRIVCDAGEIKDVVYSKEKGLIVKTSGSDLYVKFQVFEKEGKLIYEENPSELYITCGESVYSLVAVPAKIPSVTLSLADNKRKAKEVSMAFKGLAWEEKILKLLKMAYTDEIPEAFTIEFPEEDPRLREIRFSSFDMKLRRIIRTEGEGLILKEYMLTAKEGIEVREVDFMPLAERPALIALDSTMMKRDGRYRLFIIDQTDGLR